MIYIIGCGGVGSYLTPVLCMLEGAKNVTLVDGDTLEKRNLNRQLFRAEHIGMNKSRALAEIYGCEHIPEWYSEIMTEHGPRDWLIGVVDNHPARLSVLRACDRSGCSAILAANEVHSSEAMVYRPEWVDTLLDPREYYPEIAEDHSNDPRSRAAGCTGEAQEANRQLVTANFMAAALASHLYVVWAQEARKINKEEWKHLPYKLTNNLSRNETFKVGDKIEKGITP